MDSTQIFRVAPWGAPLTAPWGAPLTAPREAPLTAPREAPLTALREAPLTAPREAPLTAPIWTTTVRPGGRPGPPWNPTVVPQAGDMLSKTCRGWVMFDWGGTLAPSKTREEFVQTACKRPCDAVAMMRPEVLRMATLLNESGACVGIVSNTSMDTTRMEDALQCTGLNKLFGKRVWLDREKGCAKPEGCALSSLPADTKVVVGDKPSRDAALVHGTNITSMGVGDHRCDSQGNCFDMMV
jgi:hypothetical protein